jgi:nucleotide-binding universal stress UspA family protein
VSEPFRLVLAFDATPAALQAARFVAAHQGAAMQVLALIVPPREALAEQAGQELGLARTILGEGQIDYLVQPGFPPEVIVDEARDRAAHAIVAGTRARGGVMGLGSVASEILRGSEFPVVLVKEQARIPPALGRRARVLVASDGSEECMRAAALVAAWRGWLGEVEAHVVHAREAVPLVDKIVRPRAAEPAPHEHAAVARACGGDARLHELPGDPASVIARLAAELPADLVFMGTRGRGARAHAVFGSVAMKAVQWSPVPVVLVP